MINPDAMDYGAQEFIEGFTIKPDLGSRTEFIFNATHSTLDGLILTSIQSTGFVRIEIRDNAATFIVFMTGTTNVRDGNFHTIHIETETNASNFNFVLYVDGVEEGRNDNIDLSAGLVFDEFVWHGVGGFEFEGFIKEVFSTRLEPGLFTRAPLNGYYNFKTRLRDVASDSRRFEQQTLDLAFPISTRFIQVSDTTGIFPLSPNGYVRKVEVISG